MEGHIKAPVVTLTNRRSAMGDCYPLGLLKQL